MNFVIYPLKGTDIDQLNSIGQMLSFLKKDYPHFFNWYSNKVIPGVHTFQRYVYIASPSNNPKRVAGIMILKNTPQEKKICSLFIFEDYRSHGLGTEFLSLAAEILKTDKPVITVSSNRASAFSGLFRKMGYKLYNNYPEYYISGIDELSYNGPLESHSSKYVANA